MNPIKNKEAEAKEIYDIYWDSYTKGDLEKFASTLGETFEMIGTSESEICHTKNDGINFLKSQLHEIVGKVEMRNRQINLVPVENLVLVNEVCDIYVNTNSDWNFYSKIRLSTWLKETDEGWKVIQQHGSLPDMRVQQGETLAIDKISKENLELRDAVKRRTAELEHKNRELQIEASLEKVRALTMSMHSSEDVGKCIVKMFSELTALGVDEGTRFGIGILNHENENNQLWTARKNGDEVNMHIGNIDMASHPLLKSARQAWKDQVPIHKYVLEGEDLVNYYQMLNNAPDYKIQIPIEKLLKKEIQHCFIFEHGFFYAFTPREFQPELIHITKRFSSLFEQTYRRYLDLVKAEAQAREGEIELALERVRARTMGMHQSSELADSAAILFLQIKNLGIETYTTGFNIWDEPQNALVSWMSNPAGVINPPFIMPAQEYEQHKRFFDAWKNEVQFLEDDIADERLANHYKYLRSFPLLETAFATAEKAGFRTPARQVHNVAFFSQGYLLIVTLEPKPEFENLFKRFAKVFEQTYTRFLDLQKAEAQAREAQIEAALERVRARTMGMRKSEELSETAVELFKQLEELGIIPWSCGFNIFNENERTISQWVSTADGRMLEPFKTPSDQDIFQRFYKEYKKAQSIYIEAIGEKALKSHYEFLGTLPVVGGLLNDLKKTGFEPPSFQVNNLAFFQHGYLLFITFEQVPEYHSIFIRFAKVFQQTYTRFLDLQKAEAQSRESEIQLALERVRARSLAMHRSEELADLSMELVKQVQTLGMESWFCAFNIYEDDPRGSVEWGSNGQGTFPKYRTPREGVFLRYFETGQRGETFLVNEIGEEECPQHYEYLCTLPGVGEQLLQMKAAGIPFPSSQIDHVAFFKYGYVLFITYEPAPESHEIFKRFAHVFEQSYTRFLDLQKAEAQAREAQIEAALEKVRSRTMAMQKSEELADAAYVLFEQLNILGVTHERINIGIVDEDNNCIDFWVTEQGGQKLQTKFSGRISEPTTLSKSYKAWKKGAKSLVVDLQGEELQSWLRFMAEEIKIPFNKVYLHNRRVQTAGFFSKGMLVVTSPEPLQEEALYLLEKFAKVFDLTYTRFNDLLLAEAQAIQANENLIAIQAAKSKAEEALTELKATQTQLVQQEKLASLGQLTAGIAHEIKNPLNFVNNFSEVSIEMIGEIKEERAKNQALRQSSGTEITTEELIENEILDDIQANLLKIHEHGTRANSIVTSMLQHSRGGTGKMEATNLNAFLKEYINLSFHGMRAGKNPINVDLAFEFDTKINEVQLIKEDFSRVIINLCNNAFDAMKEKIKLYHVPSTKNHEGAQIEVNFLPRLMVSTILENGQVRISFEDNGPGIPEEIKDKILQPFFTTKKGTEGTGLGLSITHDIVKAHGGELTLISNTIEDLQKGESGTEFNIILPLTGGKRVLSTMYQVLSTK